MADQLPQASSWCLCFFDFETSHSMNNKTTIVTCDPHDECDESLDYPSGDGNRVEGSEWMEFGCNG